jgi:hypothetical protein
MSLTALTGGTPSRPSPPPPDRQGWKPVPTVYRGVEFRSRLEARWACLLDGLGVHWVYEPLDDNRYSVDFMGSSFCACKACPRRCSAPRPTFTARPTTAAATARWPAPTPTSAPPATPGMWRGHLAVSCGEYVLDATVDQLETSCGQTARPAVFHKPDGYDITPHLEGLVWYQVFHQWEEGDLHISHARHRLQNGWKSKGAARPGAWRPVVALMLEHATAEDFARLVQRGAVELVDADGHAMAADP